MAQTLFLLMIGLAALLIGAEWLVRGSARWARLLGISPLAIGLTIVAFGTSSPELVVSVQSILQGQSDIALGNIVGSNIFNVLFILGGCALLMPLTIEAKLIQWDVPIMIGVSVLLNLLCVDGGLSVWEGFLLIGGLAAYTWFCLLMGKKEERIVKEEYEKEFGRVGNANWLQYLGLIAAGLILLALGSKWLVQAAVDLARWFDVSERIIGLTIVAAGTSLPEVATSLMATLKGERDIAVGNVIGSNIFNILGILGVTAIVGKGMPVPAQSIAWDIPFMVLVALVCYPVFRSHATIKRWEGAALFFSYIIYTAFLIRSSH